MGPLATFSRYVGRQFLLWFLVMMLVLSGIIMLFEFVELLRRGGSGGISVAVAIQMTLLKLPDTVSLLFHLAVLFSAMFTFWRLTRSQELIVARAAGVSAWQFLLPVVLLAAVIGVAKIALFNPIAAAMFARYEVLEDRNIRGISAVLDISRGGLWLRQRDEDGISVIHAERTAPEEILLSNVIVFLYDRDEHYRGRIDAREAQLEDGYWDIHDAWVSIDRNRPEFVARHRLPSDLTVERIQDSFASPKTLSFWDLPDFIETLEITGFSSLRHRLHYDSLLAQPLLLAAMVLFAASFSLRHSRHGGTVVMVVTGVLTGFAMFVLNDLVMALGLAESIPALMAAWTPAGVATLLGTATLLHLEDG
ncbi:MAG: LPS export ABC transporter permease LptG [Rhodospirillaceae bacterium]|nr:LPS export ABC transporter permease LptG [Rhodospirillaceae bacterium]